MLELLCIKWAFAAWIANTGTLSAVEFYNSDLKRYFITADPQEAAMLDAGNVIKGFVRTGGQFTVYTDAGPDRSPVPAIRYLT